MTDKLFVEGCSAQHHPTIECQISTVPRKFLVHFRRPIGKDHLGKKGNKYDGSYGFDWLRDEYIYDIVEVLENNNQPTRLYNGLKIEKLKQEYTRLNSNDATDLPEVKEIKPNNGETYIPAWLALFGNSDNSGYHKNGVDLYLQIDQEPIDSDTELTDDGTQLVFEASSGVVVSYNNKTISKEGISLSPFLKTSRDSRELNESDDAGNLTGSKLIHFYQNTQQTINIKLTSTSAQPRYVKVIAKHRGKTRKVGLLMIYPNNEIKKGVCREVILCIDEYNSNFLINENGEKQYFYQTPANYRTKTKKIFNQALVNIINDEKSSIKLKKENYQDKRKIEAFEQFLNDFPKEDLDFSTKAGEDFHIYITKRQEFRDRIIQLFETLEPPLDKNYQKTNINQNWQSWTDSYDNKETFMIFTDYHLKSDSGFIYGIASNRLRNKDDGAYCESHGLHCRKSVWGNVVVMFSPIDSDVQTIPHELGHSFGLPHTFEADSDNSNNYSFYQGYTDNLMDYAKKVSPINQLGTEVDIDTSNPFRGHMNALFKWQWDILRNDRSLVSLTTN